ncbi:L-threonylcarbamoyladenylate synthase [Parasphingopyxis lamellibrachiae]|uniref:Threonylcarbamoyl-AMP synthase n=1 Tax=Parasphingopyxis lamellibrachiae TaxID=680125 RepID=A0A3D9FET1_9SPHN|nr:L-threonylcarbamoyladenylate synthase [Parasphingopyxis lamellibrachiae]RED16087.1 translation factor SUA5 [Parasphingopyxis lamellibrachiae]
MATPNPPFQTAVKPFNDATIADAASRIIAGECVAVPTETVYGLAADATQGEAVARIYAAKGRPSFNPLIVHVPTLNEAKKIARFNDPAEELAAAFWPGPLTMVLPARKDSPVASLVTAGLDTIAIRIPAHPAMQALLKASGKPLAAPSANASGRISPSCADHVQKSLGGRIGLIIDAGPTQHGLESTIVAPTDSAVHILRPGPISADRVAAAAGIPVSIREAAKIDAPGQLASHYAPSKPLRLDAVEAKADEWLIGFGAIVGDSSLSPSGDLVEAAAQLFARLHEAEASDKPHIAVAPLPATGIGAAIADRLARAAHSD